MMQKLLGVLRLQCPNCRQANMFVNPNPYAFKKLTEMHSECPNCGQDFEIEEGFYYGAMFISYILTAFLLFFWMGVIILINGYLERWQLFTLMVIAILLMPYLFRVSRTIWLSIVVLLIGVEE